MESQDVVPARTDIRLPLVGRLGLGAAGLALANAGVLIFYFFYDLSLFQLVYIYWCECVWIGVFSAFKLIVASIIGDPYQNRWASVSAGGGVIVSLVVIVLSSSAFFSLLGIALLLILFANDSLALSSQQDEIYRNIGLVIGASLILMAGHAISFIGNFLLLREYRTARVGMLVRLPFERCAALLSAIVISIAFVLVFPQFANTAAFAVVVILQKINWDLRLHHRERREFAASVSARQPT